MADIVYHKDPDSVAETAERLAIYIQDEIDYLSLKEMGTVEPTRKEVMQNTGKAKKHRSHS